MSMTITTHELPIHTTLKGDDGPDFTLERLDYANTSVEKVVKSLTYNGAVIVRSFITPAEVEKFEKQAIPVLDKVQFPSPTDTTKRVARLPSVMSDVVERVLTDELYLGVADKLLSVKHESWLGTNFIKSEAKPVVMATTMFAVAPGTKEQELHRDDAVYYNKFPAILPEQYKPGRDVGISFFVAGRKTTKQNGATQFVPGSHLTADNVQPDPRNAIAAELEAGDCLFMLSSCYHGAGANTTTDQERLVYSVFMMPPHLRQEENMYLAIPLEHIRRFPLDVQRRLGYDVALPNLGWVDHSSPMKSILGYVDGDTRAIPGYNPTKPEISE